MSRLIAQVNLQETLFGTHPVAENAEALEKPTTFLSAILPNVFVAASLLLLTYFVVGGFMYLSSASNPQQAEQGQQAATNAIIGFIIVFASYWIVQIIQILTGIPILGS